MENNLKDYFIPFKRTVLIIAAVSIIQAVLQLMIVTSVKPILKEGVNNMDVETIVSFGLITIALVVAFSVSALMVSRLSIKTSSKVSMNLRKGLFRKILELNDPNESGTNQSGLMTRLTSDIDMIQTAMCDTLRIGIYIPVLTLALIICVSLVNLPLGSIMIACTVIMFIIMFVLSKKEVAFRNGIQQKYDMTLKGLRNMVSGVKTVRAFRRQDYEYSKFSEDSRSLGNALTDAGIKVSYLTSFFTMFIGLAIIVTLTVIIYANGSIMMSMSDTVLFLQYIVLFVTCAGLIPFMVATIPSAEASLMRISEVMNVHSTGGSRYCLNERTIVRSIRDGFEISEGEEVTIVGVLGSGKSAFVSKLMRFTSPDENEILFEGSDLSTLDPSFVRSKIAYAGERTLTFRGTLFDNIDMWRGNSKEKIEECCRLALMQDIDLKKTIWKNSKGLSSGERMKISIARALASDADLYIFDDCFTELDAKTEADIVANIRRYLKGRTVLFVSTNTRIASGSDKVGYLENGKVIKCGPHDELLSSCPQYNKMKKSSEAFL